MLLVYEKQQSSFDIAMKCALECEYCAQVCMQNPEMLQCARICLDCAEICRTAVTYMVRGCRFINHLAKACAEICQTCAEECASHDLDYCQKCANVCHETVEQYRTIASVASI